MFLVIFVDELDRCRPDYAVELLERIKHLFAVENLLVVLSVDTQKLGHAASQVIGFSPKDTDGYLRRFIDLDYRLPEADFVQLINANLMSMGLPGGYLHDELSSMLASLATFRGLSARDCMHILHRYAATAKSHPKLSVAFKQFLPIVLFDAYYDQTTLAFAMSDQENANEFATELKVWRDKMDEEQDSHEWWYRDRIFRQYAYWLADMNLGALTDEEQAEASEWARRAFHRRRGMRGYRDAMMKLIAYAESFS